MRACNDYFVIDDRITALDFLSHTKCSKRQFSDLMSTVNTKLSPVGLNIDESSVEDPGKNCLLNICFMLDDIADIQK